MARLPPLSVAVAVCRAQYSIELLAQWDRKRRPIPLAGDEPAKHFGKVGLNHLPKVALCLIRDKRENLSVGFWIGLGGCFQPVTDLAETW